MGALARARLELGQTHVIDANETRVHARLIAARETLLLLTPAEPLTGVPTLIAAVFADGVATAPLGAPLTMLPPNSSALQRRLLEQDITDAEQLPPYSERAWATVVPWEWMREGTVVRVVRRDSASAGVILAQHTLVGLGAPHAFQVVTNKLVLFSGPVRSLSIHDITSRPSPPLSTDF